MLKNEMLFAKRELRVPRPVLGLLALIGLALFSTNALAESGAEIYKARCSACHAASGAGDTMLGKNMKLRALGSPDVQKESDQELAAIISRGKNRMPAYERKLSRDQIASVVKYIRSLKP
ncbi:MAG: cytochrome c [Terriglobales bacterium]